MAIFLANKILLHLHSREMITKFIPQSGYDGT